MVPEEAVVGTVTLFSKRYGLKAGLEKVDSAVAGCGPGSGGWEGWTAWNLWAGWGLGKMAAAGLVVDGEVPCSVTQLPGRGGPDGFLAGVTGVPRESDIG